MKSIRKKYSDKSVSLEPSNQDGFFVAVKKIMVLKNDMKHPGFIIGLLSFVLFLVGIVLRANSYVEGDLVVLSSIALGAIHWIWSIINVIKGYDVKPESKIFWLIIVMLIPPLGGMIYYMMKRKNISM